MFIYSPFVPKLPTHLHKYDLASPPTLRTRGHRFSVTSAVTTESGQYLFTSGKEGNIIKWDIPSGRRLATFYKIKPSLSSNNSQSNGKGKGKAKVIGTTATDVKGHSNEVLALALSSDGKYLVSGGRDRRLVVWDAEKGEWIKTFQGPMNHKDAISVGLPLLVSLFPDNLKLASIGSLLPKIYPPTFHCLP